MISKHGVWRHFPFFLATLLVWGGLCSVLWAQSPSGLPKTSSDEALIDRWRKAHEAVGQFPRGHADVLQWEQRHLPQDSSTPAVTGGKGLSRQRAIELALRDAPALLERPGLSRLERDEIRRKVREQSLEVERGWLDAVMSRQALEQARQALETAEIGAELAQRMLAVGHWSRARQMQEELPLWQARARLSQAQWTHHQALHRLWQLLGASVPPSDLQLPAHWAEPLPEISADLESLQAQALSSHPRWSLEEAQALRLEAGLGAAQMKAARDIIARAVELRAPDAAARIDPRLGLSHAQHEALLARSSAERLKRQVQADVRVALEALQTASQQARHSQSELVRLASASEQETLWRYNGMLASTWQLLASARHRMEAVEAALQARRQAWHAYFDLQALLSGLPYAGALSAPATRTSTLPKAGH